MIETDELKQKIEFHVQILNSVQQSVIVTDKNAKIILWNDFAEKLYGYTQNEVIGKTTIELISPVELIKKSHEKVEEISSGKNLISEYLVKNKAGDIFPVSLKLSPIYNKENEVIGIVGISEDISEKKAIEKALQQNQTLLAEAEILTGIGSWEWDINKDIAYWSNGLFRIFKRNPKEGAPNWEQHPAFYVKEDFEPYTKVVAECLENGTPYQFELRAICSDGEIRHCIARGKAEKNADNTTNRLWGTLQDITEQKAIERELIQAKERAEESEEKYRFLHENAGIGIAYYSLEGIVISYNQLAAKHMNGNPEDFIGKSIFDLFPKQDADFYFNRIKKAIISAESTVYEDCVQLPNKEKWFLSTFTKIINSQNKILGIQIISQDITSIKQAKIELQKAKEKAEESEIYLQTLLSIIDNVIVSRDLNDNVVYFNNAFDNVTKYLFNQPAYKGINTLKLLPKETREFWEDILLKVKNGSNNSHEYEFKSIDNKTNYYNTSHIPIIKGSEIIGTLEISKDITLFKQREIELQKAKEKAEESDRLKTAFLQNMSHEIRTPLNAISGFSGMLNKPELSEEKRKSFVSIIQNSSKQLISIVSDILTISSIETKQEKVCINKVCINNIIVDLLAIFKQQAINQNISLYAKQQLNDKQSEIYTDKTKITQILTNLLVNALKFTHEGFIEFGYNLKEYELEFYVKDSGIGIKPEFHEKIFERFRQADKSINKLYGGTGLGLAISKSFTDLLGGKIWVKSELEKGSTFYFTIPYKPVNEIDKITTPTKQNENFRTVLVAEDEEYNFLFIEELLIDMDLKLIHAKDGKETVEICKANPKIDLVLMDIKMPIMSGHEAAKLIKKFRPDLAIIAQSAYGLEQEIEKYGEIFDDYVTKPIDEDDLKQKLMKYIVKQENI